MLRVSLDGSNKKVIASGVQILSLTVDPKSDWLYYSEGGSLSIIRCNSAGMSSRTLVDEVKADKLTIYGDKLYYVNTNDLSELWYVQKDTGRGRTQVVTDGAFITETHAVNANSIVNQRRHPCANRNGDCTHICYVGSGGTKACGCPDGLILNRNNVSCEPVPTCKPTDFVCLTGNKMKTCIPFEWRCDGDRECADGSDEMNCPKICPSSQFRCSSGECIEKRKVCDRISDCSDNSDEGVRCCSPDEFMCVDSFICIPHSKQGDGVADCADASDETPQAQGPSAGTTTTQAANPYAVGIIVVLCIVSVFIFFIIVFIIWKCHKRSASLRYPEVMTMIRPVTSMSDSIGTGMIGTTMTPVPESVTATTVISASSAGGYDRNHVTGASSSSSSLTHLQAAGYNPPPSPVTERSAFIGHHPVIDEDDYSTVVSSAYPSYPPQHGTRRNVTVPPTTPISTCDDSEPSLVNYPAQRPTRTRRKSYKKYRLLQHNYNGAGAPPPTPSRSQIGSADEASECPPSPSTVRSFRSTTYNPYPPPPSPEPASDNS